MNKRLSRLGYAEAYFLKDNPWGKKGESLKGHVFHYSSLVEAEALENELAPFEIVRRKSKNKEGFLLKNLMASYVHLHWASCEESIEHFINYALECSKRRGHYESK